MSRDDCITKEMQYQKLKINFKIMYLIIQFVPLLSGELFRSLPGKSAVDPREILIPKRDSHQANSRRGTFLKCA